MTREDWEMILLGVGAGVLLALARVLWELGEIFQVYAREHSQRDFLSLRKRFRDQRGGL